MPCTPHPGAPRTPHPRPGRRPSQPLPAVRAPAVLCAALVLLLTPTTAPTAVASADVATALSRAGDAAPAQAPPRVTVLRRPSGGYLVHWTPVRGARGYTVRRSTAGPGRSASGGHLPTTARTVVRARLAATTTSLRIGDVDDPGAHTGWRSFSVEVRALGVPGARPGRGSAGCATAYFVAARGSGQNPAGGRDRGWAHGLGSRGRAVAEDLRRRTGLPRSAFVALPVRYPAAPAISGTLTGTYTRSVRHGVRTATSLLDRTAAHCPRADLYVFGYSQGAQVLGDAWNAVQASTRSRIRHLALFADPARHRRQAGVSVLPRRLPSSGGILGARLLRPGRPGQVSTWCSRVDLVCSTATGSRSHGPRYACYEDWAAHRMARVARRTLLAPRTDLRRPTCRTQR